MANDFCHELKPWKVRRRLIERIHPRLSDGAQYRLMSISRSSFFFDQRGETAVNLDLMWLVDSSY